MNNETIKGIARHLGAIHAKLYVQFMGGEPLLYLPTIRKLIRQIQEVRSQHETRFGVQSNGLLLDDDNIWQTSMDLGLEIGISFDGPGALSRHRYGQNANLCTRVIERVMQRMFDAGRQLGILAVLNCENTRYLCSLLDWAVAHKADHLLINPVLPMRNPGSYAPSPQAAAQALKKLFRHWVNNRLYRKISIRNFQFFIDNLTDDFRPFMCRRFPCGAGRDQLAFNLNGDIYPCDYMVGKKRFCLGNVRQDDPHAIRKRIFEKPLFLAQRFDSLKKCSTCPFLSICGHCPSSAYYEGKDPAGPRASCKSDRQIIRCILNELLMNREFRKYACQN